MADSSDNNRRDAFPPTRWSLVLKVQKGTDEVASLAFDQICERYWYPTYAFLRRQGHAPHDAEDLTQAFFVRMMDQATLARADQERGRLRSFLLANLKQVVAQELRRKLAEKRGGKAVVLSFDVDDAEQRYDLEPVDHLDPAILFERTWSRELFRRAWDTIRDRYEARDRGTLFQALEPLIGWHESDGDYAAIASRLGMKEASVRLHVFRMRKRFREALQDEVLHTLADPSDLDAEVRHVVALGSGQ